MTSKFSAYLSIYNDWDILPSALRSVASYVDELVVVDGAYEWMVPYLALLGVSPSQSDPRVYAAIEASGVPFRVISRTWKNEIEKRQAGYEACRYQYVYRVDADEIMFFNDAALEAALSRNLAAGAMEMPNYVAPGWISCAKDIPNIERQCFLFDRTRVNSEIHLNYLWLVLTADTLPKAGTKPFPVDPEPLAFNAHLNTWRTTKTSMNRAAFYILNWMRKNGVPWLSELQNRPLTNMQDLFDVIPPSAFLSSMTTTQIGMGMTEAADSRVFRPTPLSAAQEATFADLYKVFLGDLAATNVQLAQQERDFITGIPILLDLSTNAARNALAPDGKVILRMSMSLVSARVRLLTYATTEPQKSAQTLEVTVSGRDMEIVLPEMPPSERGMLRQCLEIQVWSHSKEMHQRFRTLV